MKLIKEGFSIVIVGAWNPKIFSPTWIKNNLSELDKSEIQLAVPLNSSDFMLKISFDNINIFISQTKLEIKPDILDESHIFKCSEATLKILKTLSHTPIAAVGVNFIFTEQDRAADIIDKLTLVDLANIDSEKYGYESMVIQRTFLMEKDIKLRFSVTMNNSKTLRLDFNYHLDVNDHNAVYEILSKEIVKSSLENSISFLKDAYNIEYIEEENSE